MAIAFSLLQKISRRQNKLFFKETKLESVLPNRLEHGNGSLIFR